MPLLYRLCRTLLLVGLATVGTCVLMYTAPGYFSDTRELDASHGDTARLGLEQLRHQQASVGSLLRGQVRSWSHGDLGRSRQFDIPVVQLLRERSRSSAELLFAALALGWSIALLGALLVSLRRSAATDLTLAVITASCLAVPVGALATFSLVAGVGSPTLILSLVLAVRDFKLLDRLVRSAWEAPHVLHAQAQGMSSFKVLQVHLAPRLRRELLSMGTMSFILALSALVPVEVIFDRPGLGQLAWSAAMNRDLPVLVAVTGVMAACIGVASCFAEPERAAGDLACV